MLQAYFRSGWALLIPYLAAYLLYAWLRWPVNPPTEGGVEVGSLGLSSGAAEGVNVSIGTSSSLLSSPSSLFPSLLHVYWAFHVVHLLLAALALRAWWKEQTLKLQPLPAFWTSTSKNVGQTLVQRARWNSVPASTGAFGTSVSGLPSPASPAPPTAPPFLPSPFSLLQKVAPWACLALLFWIPGLYLEWPSDPWEHLRRINEWHILDQVTAHSSWKKSSYFLPYSLTGQWTGLTQLAGLNFYHTAVCLLLSWQYYRLARVVGLSERASFVFVLLNALTFGNNIFSFYRYYGLSSSILAQLGAVALTRIAIEVLGAQGNQVTPPYTVYRALFKSPPFSSSSLLQVGACACALAALTALNHVQGLGIAGLCILAVVVWRLIVWKRSMIVWLAGAAIFISIATILWFPRNPALDDVYRPQGWLNSWYGFNFFSLSSPAAERSLHILGIIGLLNLAFGFWLVMRRNSITGWLTIMPITALALPCFALPLAYILGTGTDSILTFHRMLFAIPAGLAIATAFDLRATEGIPSWRVRLRKMLGNHALVSGGLAIAIIGIGDSFPFSRVWHALQVTPDDLQMSRLVERGKATFGTERDTVILRIDLPLTTDVSEALRPKTKYFVSRRPELHVAEKLLAQRLDWLGHAGRIRAQTDGGTSYPHVIATPLATNAPWIVLAGLPPEQKPDSDGWSLANPFGQSTEVFSPNFIAISRDKRYRLVCSLRREGNPEAISLLAVAWYDSRGKLLQSNVPKPEGVGEPLGWSNGTYSYYASYDNRSPEHEKTYSITFGLGEPVEIPLEARFFRVGALLNYRGTPGVKVVLSRVALVEIPPPSRLLMEVPDFAQQTSPASLSAMLSGHWSPQHVSAAQAGAKDLFDAAGRATEP